MLTPEQKIKFTLLLKAYDADSHPLKRFEDIHEEYDRYKEKSDTLHELEYEFREGEVETNLQSKNYSRHYENKEVAAKMYDGSWVGWTYWYGGGKHAEPEAIDWMNEAYDLDVTEEEKLITVRTFHKKDGE